MVLAYCSNRCLALARESADQPFTVVTESVPEGTPCFFCGTPITRELPHDSAVALVETLERAQEA